MTKVEITEEMIEAGVRAISKWADADEMVAEIYVAMESVRRRAASDQATGVTLEFTNVDNGDGTLTRTAQRLIVDLKPTP